MLGSLAGWGEKLEAVVSLVAIAVLLLILNWFYHRVYWQENLSDLHKRKKRILAGASIGVLSAQAIGLIALGFSSVYREGFETVLFLQAMSLEAGPWTVLQGVAVGFAGVLAVFGLVIALERRLPHKKMLIATGVLITGVLAVLVGHTVQTTQVVGWVPVTPVEGLTLPYWAGTWFGLFPTWEGLVAQAAAVAFVVGSYLAAEAVRRRKRARILDAPVARTAAAATARVDALAADLPGQVRELRLEELLPRERDGLRGAGHRDEHRAAVRARRRAREHRRRADLLPAQHPEELAEPGKGLLEQARERVVRRVALGDAGPSVDDDDLRAPHEVVHRGADLVRLVADDVVAGDDRSGRGDALLEPRAVRVGLARSRVADRDHADRHRAALLRGGAMCVGSHRARSYG